MTTLPKTIVNEGYKYVTHPSQLVQGMECEFDEGGPDEVWKPFKWTWLGVVYDGVKTNIQKGLYRITLLTEEQLAGIEGIGKHTHQSGFFWVVDEENYYEIEFYNLGHIKIFDGYAGCLGNTHKNLTLPETISILNTLA
jgi:hypothetical protein